MDAAEFHKTTGTIAEAHVVLSDPDRADAGSSLHPYVNGLTEEIDRLRSVMTETFLKEASFTADSVIHVSRLLDVKINEYMAHVSRLKQAR